MTSETTANRSRRAGNQGRTVTFLVAFLAILGAVVGVFVVLGQRQQVTALRQQLELSHQQVTQLESQNRDLTTHLKTFEEERKTVNEKLASLKAQLTSATTELGLSRKSMEDLQARYESLEQAQTQTQARLGGVTTELAETKGQATRLEQEKAGLQRSVTRLRERLTWLDRDYRQVAGKLATLEAERAGSPSQAPESVSSEPAVGPEPSAAAAQEKSAAGQVASEPAVSSTGQTPSAGIAGAVELPPIIVRKDEADVSPPVQGKLVDVNEPHGFIVVDKGSLDGVHVGMNFKIFRENAVVGRASVVRVRPHLSASNIVRSDTPTVLSIGDLAVQNVE